MLKVGLTGGIGSGKSLVSKIFSLLGIYVYNADIAAKDLYNTNNDLKTEMKKLFGENIYSDGILDKQKLASIIFSDKQKLAQINTLVHPAVFADFEIFVSKLPETPYVIHETAILFEAGMSSMFDYIINVCAPEELRINRVLQRETNTTDNVKKRIANQWADKERAKSSDFNIINDDKEMILPQILSIHKQLTKLR